jgi:predicted nucleic acid-binding protein
VQVVIDADCVIAGTLAGSGAASRLLDLWQLGAFELIACPKLIGEVRKALLDRRVSVRYGITAEEVDALCRRIEEESIYLADPVDPPRVVPGDPGDDYLVALALNGMADALITRDRHFNAVAVEGLRILPPRAFLPQVES